MSNVEQAAATCAARRLKVRVDENRCIGIGDCEMWAPAHFRLNADRIAEPIEGADVDEDTVLQAAMECPVEAITVETEDGKVLWPPY